jgi:hypothetical protein
MSEDIFNKEIRNNLLFELITQGETINNIDNEYKIHDLKWIGSANTYSYRLRLEVTDSTGSKYLLNVDIFPGKSNIYKIEPNLELDIEIEEVIKNITKAIHIAHPNIWMSYLPKRPIVIYNRHQSGYDFLTSMFG